MNQRHQDLLNGYCSGILSETEFAELQDALRRNPELRQTLLECRALESALRVTAAAETAQHPPPAPAGFPGHWRTQSYALAASIALLLAAGATVLWRGAPQSQNVQNTPFDRGVAVLSRTLAVEWVGGRGPQAGDSIPPGRWQLASGVAELEFYNGASVILQGPADLEISSADGGILHAGKLRAQVPEHAHGFTITSPDVKLVDLGTAFGMEVGSPDGTDVHVFEGKVHLFEIKPGAVRNEGRELVAGQGRRVSLSGGSSSIAVVASDFLSPTELNRQSKEHFQLKHNSWRNEFEQSLSDARLVARYGFEPELEDTRLLRNFSSNQEPGLVGSIVGARWSDGRWPGKQALDFKRPGDRVRITVPGEYASVTLAAWVRVDGFDYQFCSLLLSDGWDRAGAVHWQISKTGYISLAVWNGPDANRHNSRVKFVIEPSDFGRWMHLAAVYDGASGTVRHYRNAELIGEVAVSPLTPLRVGDALIGNWSPAAGAPNPIRILNGRMDEFAIFGQALSPGEIQELHRAGKP